MGSELAPRAKSELRIIFIIVSIVNSLSSVIVARALESSFAWWRRCKRDIGPLAKWGPRPYIARVLGTPKAP